MIGLCYGAGMPSNFFRFVFAAVFGLCFIACANSDEIDTRLNKQSAVNINEVHSTYSIPQGIVPADSQSDTILLEVQSKVQNPRDPLAIQAAAAPSFRSRMKIVTQIDSTEQVWLEWHHEDHSQKFKARLPRAIDLESNNMSSLARIAIGHALVQVYLWEEDKHFLRVMLRTTPLFPLRTVNSFSTGTDLFLLFRKDQGTYKSESYFFGTEAITPQNRDFDFTKVRAQIKSAKPVLLKVNR